MPNLSVNAHQYSAPLAAAGRDRLRQQRRARSARSARPPAAARNGPRPGRAGRRAGRAGPGAGRTPRPRDAGPSLGGTAQAGGQAQQDTAGPRPPRKNALTSTASVPGEMAITGGVTSFSAATSSRGTAGARRRRASRRPGSAAQQAFIDEIAPGAPGRAAAVRRPGGGHDRAGHRRVGLGPEPAGHPGQQPVRDQGNGPGGLGESVPTQEYENGQPVTVNAPFRVYSNVAQSISDHSLLLASGSAYSAGHGRPPLPGRVRQRPHRRLRHRSRLWRQPHHDHAAVQPVPLRRRDAGRAADGRGQRIGSRADRHRADRHRADPGRAAWPSRHLDRT